MSHCASEAIILRRCDYGEADRIVTFFSLDQGLVKGFARRARNSRRRFGTALEPFARVCLHWTTARGGELVSLCDAELLDLRTALRRDVSTLALAATGGELVEALVAERQPQADVFVLLEAFLDHLARRGFSAEARLLFELRLLTLAGYAPHLAHCALCSRGLSGSLVAFDIRQGGALCLGCAEPEQGLRLSPLTLGTLARLQRTPLAAFDGLRLTAQTLQEGGRLLAAALRPQLERPLRSAVFLQQVLSARTDGSPVYRPAETG